MKSYLKRLIHRSELESGQVIILLALMSIGLIAIMGLAIDGGRLLFLRRDTQNAADAAAWAAARALCTARDPSPYALSAANANGFDNDLTSNWVDVYSPPVHADFPIPEECRGCYVEVNVKGKIPPTFIGIVYNGELAASTNAIGVCNPDINNIDNRAPELRAMWAMGGGGGTSECSPVGVTVTGANINIVGGAHSNGHMKIMPGNNKGTVTGATSVVNPHAPNELVHGQDKVTWSAGSGGGGGTGGGTTPTGQCDASCFASFDPTIDTIPEDGKPYQTNKKNNYPVSFTIDQFQPGGSYATLAAAAGQYYEFPCSGKFWDWVKANHMTGGVMDDGIYYAACDMDITKNADAVTGRVTFATTGTINVKGDGQQWQPYTDGLIMFANSNEGCSGPGAVKFSGNNNSWNGIIFAPRGTIKMSASTNNSAAGCLIGLSVEVSGSDNSIICNPATIPHTPQSGFWIAS